MSIDSRLVAFTAIYSLTIRRYFTFTRRKNAGCTTTICFVQASKCFLPHASFQTDMYSSHLTSWHTWLE